MALPSLRIFLTSPHYVNIFIALIMLGELALGIAIIWKVPYTEIDWIAYMQEVQGFLSGQWDYSQLKGDTGPLVYPAGFVYLYSFLYWITSWGTNIRLAQYIFLGIYLVFIYVVMRIYQRCKMPPWLLLLLSASRRIHSIFMLRLFNDCFAMLLLYIAIWLFLKNRWSIGCFVFSLAVSIKMNILLFAPSLFFLLLQRLGVWQTIRKLMICAVTQLILGAPFLLTYPKQYFHGAFDFGRQFMYVWTVNLKFLDEPTFLSKKLALGLLATHLFLLLLTLAYMTRPSIFTLIRRAFAIPTSREAPPQAWPDADYMVTSLFIGNFIGIVFSRSLHYQFYVWYYHSLPLLLFLTPYPTIFKLFILGVIEITWNVFPATHISSGALAVCHALILLGLALSPRLRTLANNNARHIEHMNEIKTEKKKAVRPAAEKEKSVEAEDPDAWSAAPSTASTSSKKKKKKAA